MSNVSAENSPKKDAVDSVKQDWCRVRHESVLMLVNRLGLATTEAETMISRDMFSDYSTTVS